MTQISGDQGTLLPIPEAHRLLQEHLSPIADSEHVPTHKALGRILAKTLLAERAVPEYVNSAVDGYALRLAEGVKRGDRLPVARTIRAGDRLPDSPIGAGEAVRVLTGAPLPSGADTVIMQEDVETHDNAIILRSGVPARHANMRFVGDDIQKGDAVLEAGCRLGPAALGVAVSLGRNRLEVRKRLRIALISTGQEITKGQAGFARIRDSNAPMLRACFERLGCRVFDYSIVADHPGRLSRCVRAMARKAQLIVSTGGISEGDTDHMLQQFSRVVFRKLALKPGRPVAMGFVESPANQWYADNFVPLIALPGNPVAAFVCFLLIARPASLILQGASHWQLASCPARLGFDYRKKSGRREYVRVCVKTWRDGLAVLERYGKSGAGILSSVAGADGLAELDEQATQLKSGDPVRFIRFASIYD